MTKPLRGAFAALIIALLALAVPLVLPTSAAAQSEAAKAFGAREQVSQASLSPDGKSVAIVRPLASSQAAGLFIARAGADGFKPILSSSGAPDRLTGCGWVSNTRLICNIFIVQGARRIGYTRLVAIDADGANLQVLTARGTGREYGYQQDGGDVLDWLADDAAGAVMVTRAFAEENSTGTLLAAARQGVGVERVDSLTLKRSLIVQPRREADFYISDQHGAVRIYAARSRGADGNLGTKLQFFSRPAAGGPWVPLSAVDEKANTGFRPVAVDRDLNVAYGFEQVNGRQAVIRLALDGSLKREVISARDDVDVDELIRIGRQRRVVGVGFATDRRQAIFFDPALKILAASLSKALPGQPQVRFVDASQDESRLLIWTGSDIQPGQYYLYDKSARQLSPVIEERPQLAAFKLAPVRAVTYAAADGTQIPAYLTLPPGSDGKSVPAIVLPHGGPGARDEWGFDWLSQYFASRGFAVLQPNFRGSTGYGEKWFQKNGFQSWRTAIGDVNDAGRWLTSQGIAAPGKLAIVGWSYGGYAALQSQVLDPDLFHAVVAIAPVTDLDRLREEARPFTNFDIVDAYIGHGAHIREGSPAQNVDKLKAPVLMFHGDQDDNVGVAESRLMLARLKSAGRTADLIVYPGLDHQLEDDKARADMLERADVFLRTTLGL
jgi:dipeptidyl aminopeptidase/acylaminoacyl peptidase